MKKDVKKLVASDVMQRDTFTISPDNTLREALALMTENHVTGLPVMDRFSRCIGLITATDILNYEQEHGTESAETGNAQFFDPELQRWESIQPSAFALEEIGETRVSDVMTRGLVWVHEYTPLKLVAQRMIKENIHRVLVMDVASRLHGVLSAYDFVRVVADADA